MLFEIEIITVLMLSYYNFYFGVMVACLLAFFNREIQRIFGYEEEIDFLDDLSAEHLSAEHLIDIRSRSASPVRYSY